jgi:hypothetical protein
MRHVENRWVVHCFMADPHALVFTRHAVSLCLIHRFSWVGLGLLHVRVDRTAVRGCDMLEHIAKVGSTVQWVTLQRHARGGHVTSGMVWSTAPQSAGIAQGPRSLCHKLTYPLLQRDEERPADAWAPGRCMGMRANMPALVQVYWAPFECN